MRNLSKKLYIATWIFALLSLISVVSSYIAWYTNHVFGFDSVHWTIDAIVYTGLSIMFGVLTLITINVDK